METLRLLVDWKKIPSITPTLVKSWRYGLSGISENQIDKGLSLTRDHVGYFDLGIFRKFCFRQEASHREHRDLPRLANQLGNGRFKELKKVTDAMCAEVGEGPITKATNAGRLTAGFVRGKSAKEIIQACQEMSF